VFSGQQRKPAIKIQFTFLLLQHFNEHRHTPFLVLITALSPSNFGKKHCALNNNFEKPRTTTGCIF